MYSCHVMRRAGAMKEMRKEGADLPRELRAHPVLATREMPANDFPQLSRDINGICREHLRKSEVCFLIGQKLFRISKGIENALCCGQIDI